MWYVLPSCKRGNMRTCRTAGLTAHDGPLFTGLGLLTTFNINKFTKYLLLISFTNLLVLKNQVHLCNTLLELFCIINFTTINRSDRRSDKWMLQRLQYDWIGEHIKSRSFAELILTSNRNTKSEGQLSSQGTPYYVPSVYLLAYFP